MYDYLTVSGVRYCGTSPEGIVPDGTPIEWVTDTSVKNVFECISRMIHKVSRM